MTAVAAPPITEIKCFAPANRTTETPSTPEPDELPLNPEERQQLGRALPAYFEFFAEKPFKYLPKQQAVFPHLSGRQSNPNFSLSTAKKFKNW